MSLAVIGLTYDSTSIQENPFGLFLEIVHGLNEGPDVRGTDVVVPGLAYRIPGNRIADALVLELRGYVAGIGTTEAACRTSFAAYRRSVGSLFDPTRSPANLVATLEDGTTRTFLARPLPGQVWNQIMPALAEVSIELSAYSIVVAGTPPV